MCDEFETNYNDPFDVFKSLYDEVMQNLNNSNDGRGLMQFVQYFFCDDFTIGFMEIPFDRHRFMREIVLNTANSELDRGTKLVIETKFKSLQNAIDAKFEEVFNRPFYLQLYYMAKQYIN